MVAEGHFISINVVLAVESAAFKCSVGLIRVVHNAVHYGDNRFLFMNIRARAIPRTTADLARTL